MQKADSKHQRDAINLRRGVTPPYSETLPPPVCFNDLFGSSDILALLFAIQ